jgi:hypothetical protein
MSYRCPTPPITKHRAYQLLVLVELLLTVVGLCLSIAAKAGLL